MKRNNRIAVIAIVLSSLFLMTSLAFAGDRNHGHRSHRDRDIAAHIFGTIGAVLLVEASNELIRSYQPRHHQRRHHNNRNNSYGNRGRSGSCGQFYDIAERSACEQGLAERNARIQRDRIDRAYRHGRGEY